MFQCLADDQDGTFKFWPVCVGGWLVIAKIEMTSDEDTGVGKEQVGGIGVTIQDNVTCMLLDDGVRISCCTIQQAVAFGDSVKNRFLLLCGDLVQGGENDGIECLGIIYKGNCNGLK